MQTNRLGIAKSGRVKAVGVAKTEKARATGTVCAETPGGGPEHFVGIDLHKKFMQVALMDSGGKLLQNKRVECDLRNVEIEFSKLPAGAKYVMESSSVWYGMYRFLRDRLGLNVMLSNPLATKRIAESKKKTDKVDAEILADLLRGGYISGCYVPDDCVVKDRQLIRFRSQLIKERTKFKNGIHGILLQQGTRIQGQPFTSRYVSELRRLDDWRIEKYLGMIAFLNGYIADCDARIQTAMSKNESAKLLKTVPGIGNITALALASEIDDISRFSDMDHLVSYFGLVPSVRNSASTVHHGRITKTGNSLVRRLLTEAVLVHMMFARNRKMSTPISSFYERLSKKRGVSKARVAAAAKMLRIVFWMLKKKIDFWTCVKEGRKSTYREPKKKGSQSVKNHG